MERPRRSPPTTPTWSCRTPRSTRCTARTSPVPPRTSPTTWRRLRRTCGPTVHSRSGTKARAAAKVPRRPAASSPRSNAGEGSIGYADASQIGDLPAAAVGVAGEFVEFSPEAAGRIVDSSERTGGQSEFDFAIEVNRTPDSADTYPIALVSYHIVCLAVRQPGDRRSGQGVHDLRRFRRGAGGVRRVRRFGPDLAGGPGRDPEVDRPDHGRFLITVGAPRSVYRPRFPLR